MARKAEAAGRLSGQAVSGAKWIILGMSVQTLLRLLVIGILARLLTPADFGTMAAVMVVISFGEIRLGAGAALVQFQDVRPSHVGAAFFIALSIGTLLGLLVLATSEFLESILSLDGVSAPLQVLAVTFPLRSVSQTFMRLLQRRFAFKIIAVFDSIGYFVGFGIVGVYLAANGFGTWALVWAYLTMCAISFALIIVASRNDISFRIEAATLRELLSASRGISMLSLLQYALSNVAQVFIGRAFGAAALGLYSRGLDLTNRVNNILDRLVSYVLFPVYSRLQHDRQRSAAAFEQGLLAVALFTIPGVSVLILLSSEIVLTVLGSQWEDTVPIFRALSVALIFRVGTRMAIALASGFGRFSQLAWAQLWTFLALVSSLALTLPFGPEAMAWAYALGSLIGCALSIRVALKLTGITPIECALVLCRSLPLTGATIAATVVGRMAALEIMGEPTAVSLLVTLVLSAAALGGAALLFPSRVLTEAGRKLVGRVLDNLFPRFDPFGLKRVILR